MWGFQSDMVSPLRESFIERSPEVMICNLNVIKAKGIPGGDPVTKLSNPFLEVRLSPGDPGFGEQKMRGSNKTSTIDPEWMPYERFQFRLEDLSKGRFVFSLYHLLPMRPPVPLADAVLNLRDLKRGMRNKAFKLKLKESETGEVHGTLHIQISIMSVHEASHIQEHAIYEYQRWNGGWGSTDHFLPMDPGRWSTLDGKKYGLEIDDIAPPVPPGWRIKQAWFTGPTSTDPDGWEYSNHFKSNYWHAGGDNTVNVVRRRVWQRAILRVAT